VDGGRTIHIWAPPGSYTVELITTRLQIDWEKKTWQFLQDEHTAAIVVKGVGPDPGPDPPVPPPGQRWALVVEETGQRTPQQAALLTKLRSEYQSRLVIADKDSTASKLRPYISKVPATIPLPVLVVASMDGVIIRVVALPQTVEGFRQEMAR
jgi:hypothetical protein